MNETPRKNMNGGITPAPGSTGHLSIEERRRIRAERQARRDAKPNRTKPAA